MALAEVDTFATTQSRYYDTRLLVAPRYLHYVIDAEVSGVPVRYSDDPSISTLVAGPGAAVQVWFQGTSFDPFTNEPIAQTPWRTSVRGGLDGDNRAAFRFRIARDAQFGQVVVKRVSVVYSL